MTWSAQQYTRFEDERTRPVRDLVAAIPRDDVRTAVDLGCSPAHRIARDVAAQGPWSGKLAQVAHPDRHDAAWNYALLEPLCTRVDVWRTTYLHPLQDHDAIVEWFKGSALRLYLAPLDAQERQEFLAAYRQDIVEAYPLLADGTALLPFPRLFIVATR